MDYFFNALIGACAQTTIEPPPLDGVRGVWLKSGTYTISSAMTMSDVLVDSRQVLYVYASGSIYNVSTVAGAVSSGGSIIIYYNGVAESTLIDANNVAAKYYYLTVSSGGHVLSTTITNRASAYINQGAASSTIIAQSAIVSAWSGAVIYADVINNGSLYLTLPSASHLRVSSGGRIITWGQGSLESVCIGNRGNVYVSTGVKASNIVISGGTLHLSGGNAEKLAVEGYSSQGFVSIYVHGHASAVEVKHSGILSISGGDASSVVVSSGGVISVYGGNYLVGSVTSSAYGHCNFLVVSSGGHMVLGGGLGGGASNATIYGSVSVAYSGHLNAALICSGGRVEVVRYGQINGATVDAGGYVNVFNGSAVYVTIQSGGRFIISGQYATAHDIIVSVGGSLSPGTVQVKGIKECGGYVFIPDSGTATFGYQVFSGAVLGGGNTATVHSATTAVGTVINSGGAVLVYSRGRVNFTTINEQGKLTLYSAASASGVTVNSGGYLVVNSGGRAEGVVVNSGGIVSGVGYIGYVTS